MEAVQISSYKQSKWWQHGFAMENVDFLGTGAASQKRGDANYNMPWTNRQQKAVKNPD